MTCIKITQRKTRPRPGFSDEVRRDVAPQRTSYNGSTASACRPF
ncbi:hypothetical protein [Lysobacter gummosus]